MSRASSYSLWTSRVLVLLIAGTISGCVTGTRHTATSDRTMIPTMGARGMSCCAMAKAMPRQTALAKTAVRFVGQSRIQIAGRSFNPDCSGFVRGVYASQRVDLYSGLGELDGGNGVGRIYTHVMEHGRIHYGPTVHPGDLVFFHNTWISTETAYPTIHSHILEWWRRSSPTAPCSSSVHCHVGLNAIG